MAFRRAFGSSSNGTGGKTLPRSTVLAALAAAPVVLPKMVRAQSAPFTIRTAAAPTETMIPLVYAMRAGLFEKVGLKIEYSKMESGAAVAAAVAAGAIDIGSSSMLSLILGHAHGVPFTLVAPSGLAPGVGAAGLLVPSSSPLRAPKDFIGKTISAAAVNDINSLAMQAWLDQNGVDSKSVRFVEIPQLAALPALEQGRVDAITVANPAYELAVESGKTRLVADIFTAIAPRYMIVGWFSTTDWVERNRDATERFARVMGQASIYVNGHANETAGDVVDLTGLDANLVRRMQRYKYTSGLVVSDVQPVIDAAAKYKVLERSFPATEIISDAALR